MIIGTAFYIVATLLYNMVGDSLFQTRVLKETATVESLAVTLAPSMAAGDADRLYSDALSAGREVGGRVLVVDPDGKVQMDTFAALSGVRLSHPEVAGVLNGKPLEYGFHLLSGSGSTTTALFDFLRPQESERMWVGYFCAPLIAEDARVGAVLFVVSVQDMVDNLRAMQDRMLFVFFATALSALIFSLIFARIITKPIVALTGGIRRMGRGDLSVRVPITGIDEMARLAEMFNQMSEKLEHLDASRNQFVSNASHELKTPLATMKILLESMLYQDDMPTALRSEFLTDINQELDRLSHIITDLLTLVSGDASDYQLVRKSVLLSDLTREAIRRLEPLWQKRSLTMDVTIKNDCLLFADPVKLSQALYNLLDNAIKYSPKETSVKVTVKQEGQMAVFEVHDSGPGIPQKDQVHIFDRFYRVDKARSRATGGNGLGLSIVHQAVLMHSGQVSVISVEGKGATFRVELPIST